MALDVTYQNLGLIYLSLETVYTDGVYETGVVAAAAVLVDADGFQKGHCTDRLVTFRGIEHPQVVITYQGRTRESAGQIGIVADSDR